MNVIHENKRRSRQQAPRLTTKNVGNVHHPEFVIQRHKASSLHYDFRLEIGGVLKSWAVPKGPSMNPTDKRLAIMVEDHPITYGSFEGVIPPGNYGAGIVEIWDSGTFIPYSETEVKSESEISGALKNGSLKFILNGSKLKGQFSLIKMKHGPLNSWLLIKNKDEFAVNSAYNSEWLSDSPILMKIPAWRAAIAKEQK